ncbi:exopolysaccharide biosynthesis protein [Crenobacter intestini]|uniref:Exopolysaccharide biosynthesis protein n=1 Tax=Crenobacter intestini TaxID=2563443 RepID=A0A4T0UJ75_9NEIS|nr:exopolysaccharide biosynthesis protein [Crenobacter intestini]TIC78610.1 exopolysaccharide biosynthesis protein [Crenobacter intestini]
MTTMPRTRPSALWRRLHAAPPADARVADAVGRHPRHQLDRVALLSLPMLLPAALPGMSTTLGVLTVLLALAYLRGQAMVLPAWLAERRLPAVLPALIARLQRKVFGLLERVARPRWRVLSGAPMRAANAGMLAVAGLALLTPVPLVSFDNVVPAAAIVLLTLGLRLRDGALLLAGYAATVAGAASTALLWWGLSVAGKAGVDSAANWLQRL